MEDPLLPGASVDQKLDRVFEILRSIADEEPEMRRRLRRLRESPHYFAAFEEPDPLVSIVVTTYTSFETLRDRALPSALAQTHRNIEVVVVGDAAPPETAEVIRAFGDRRVRYDNLPMRGPYPPDPARAWLMSGTPPYNAAVAMAQGLWIAPLADDDAFMPEHIEQLLELARERRLELVYGRLLAHLADGSETLIGEFPPRWGQFGVQGCIYHAALSFMELSLSDELFDVPNDWSLCRRMMRAGVRMGMLDKPTAHYYPSAQWGRRTEPSEPVAPADDELERLRARVAELEHQLAVLTSSKSWRMTSPLRAAGRRARDAGKR